MVTYSPPPPKKLCFKKKMEENAISVYHSHQTNVVQFHNENEILYNHYL